MLTRLTVKNLALIENLELAPCGHLNILSGETGAGKSIIVDGIMLLLGARYDKTLIRYGAESGFVEGVFDACAKSLEVLRDFGFDEEDCIIINRKFSADGRSEIRINGRAATIGMLKLLTATLVDIYGQNEYQALVRPSEHLRILDYYVRHTCKENAKNYALLYAEYKTTVSELDKIGDGSAREREIDLLRYQVDEINNAKTYENEEEELLERRNIITSAEKIYEALGHAVDALAEREDGCANELLGEAQKELSGISHLKSAYSEYYDRLQSVAIELSDIGDALRDELGDLNFDLGELDEVEKRLDFIRTLKRKYGSYTDMLVFASNALVRLEYLENADEHYSKLFEKKEKLLNEMYDLARSLHDKRVAGAKEFSDGIKKHLHELGMENSDFTVEIPEFPERANFVNVFGSNGADTAEFYLSPNAGQPLKPLIKIISGGEMSRFMLALKVISNESDDIPTMIFDEIDAGISGITGQVVAKKLAAISRKHQILCVTHLPQIASMADKHFFISKHTEGNSTVTEVVALDENGMISEISRLSGSKGISAQSDSNAGTMKKWSDDFKKSL